MKSIFLILLFCILSHCNKPRSVLICGDHICVNKAEAKQYFEKNLTIEVRILDKKTNKKTDLVELNLERQENGKKKINLRSKNQTSKKLKILSNDEIKTIKNNIKRDRNNKIVKKKIKKGNIIDKNEKKEVYKNREAKTKIIKKTDSANKDLFKIDVNKRQENLVDVCTILEKCSIDEISKYLIKQGKKKDYPDITTRQ